MNSLKRAGEYPFREKATELMNKLFGKSEGPDMNDFWTETLLEVLVSKFDSVTFVRGASKEDRIARCASLNASELKIEREQVFGEFKRNVDMLEVFHRISKMLGLTWEQTLVMDFSVHIYPSCKQSFPNSTVSAVARYSHASWAYSALQCPGVNNGGLCEALNLDGTCARIYPKD